MSRLIPHFVSLGSVHYIHNLNIITFLVQKMKRLDGVILKLIAYVRGKISISLNSCQRASLSNSVTT
jgi:hypothetical protein